MKTLAQLCVIALLLVTVTISKGQDKGQALIIQTSSQKEVSKILETLKGQDPATYRLTVSGIGKNGRRQSKTYGTASVGGLKKIEGSVKPATGVINASDLIMLGEKSYVINGKEIRDRVISRLDQKLTKQTIQTIHIPAKKAKL